MSSIAPETLTRSQLPVIQRPLDHTALSAYMTCPRDYLFSMVMHRRTREQKAALSYGSIWHKVLEIHYRSNGHRDTVQVGTELFAAAKKFTSQAGEYRTLQRALIDYDKYVKEYGKPSLENGTTVGYPDAPLIEMSTNVQGERLIHPWAGKLDRIIRIGSLYYVEDHKTTSRFDRHYFRQYELSYQMKGYTYLGQQLLPDKQIVGVRINLAHVLTGKTEFKRELFPFSKEQVEEWERTTNSWMSRLGRDTERYLELIDKGMDAFEAMLETFPAHFGDNGCSRKYGMCQYHEVCSAGPKIQSKLLERDFDVRPWNPLEVDDD